MENDNKNELNEPKMPYSKSVIKIFKSFKEQEDYEFEQMGKLSSLQILQQLRKFINIAYGMHGYNPNNLPNKHSITILTQKNI
jgi:hypothetical protein